MTIPAYQQRVIDEHAELKEWHTKLSAFIMSDARKALPEEDQSLLYQQLGLTAQLMQTLALRIARFNVVPENTSLLTLAKQCGAAVYTNRHMPGEPAVAFGHEGWAKFCIAVGYLADKKDQEETPQGETPTEFMNRIVPDGCKLNYFYSGCCRRGTKSCIIHHEEVK
jgi:hypothetical protein